MTPIPAAAPEDLWYAPTYLGTNGGRQIGYPMIWRDQQYGLFHEVVTDWHDIYALLAAIGWQRYDGDVWSIQLTARPGYYVTPEQLTAYGLGQGDFPPLG
jgi:hypothetical protein